MDLNDYFDFALVDNTKRDYLNPKNQLLKEVFLHSEDNPIKNVDDFNIAIIGVYSDEHDIGKSALDQLRSDLYSLSLFEKTPKIIDLGNIKQGKTQNDTIIGLRDVLVELLTSNVFPIIIGPAELVQYASYKAYQVIGEKINFVSIDSKINISENRADNQKSALWRILVEEKDSLFAFSNIGYQSHFVSPNITKFLSEQSHFAYRLGYIKSNLNEVEPILRDTDMLGLNISSIRQSDAFGQKSASPNGFYGEEICQLARYGGMSTKLSSFGIYDFVPENDFNQQTSNLIAQIIWYFISGFNYKVYENPIEDNNHCKKFIVNLDTFEYEIVFYKSEKTDRWWMEVPSFKTNARKNLLVSCTYNDYQLASNGDVPERWLKAFQKMNH